MRMPLPQFLAALTILATLATTVGDANAQELTATPLGEYLVRFRHVEGHDFAPGGVDNFVRHRARFGLRFAYGEELQALLQVQDVRVWGEETDTLGDYSADGFDLHQGYMEIAFEPELRLRIGRQEIGYLNHRLIGTVGFAEQARSFDAVRLMARALDQRLSIDLMYARTLDDLPEGSLAADDVFAGALKLQLNDWFQPALIAVVDLNSATDRIRFTNGLVLQADFTFGLRFSLEGYLQAGGATIDEADVSYFAWMFATHIRYTFVDMTVAPYVELFAELLSGDDDPADPDETTFDTLFATNHRYYGEMDFFLNLPRDTAERGLVDTGAAFGAQLFDIAFARLAVHVFLTMADQGGDSSYGQEVDLTFGLKPNPHLSFDVNYSVFIPGKAFVESGDPEHFVYTTARASF